jgi:hypothetical protein
MLFAPRDRANLSLGGARKPTPGTCIWRLWWILPSILGLAPSLRFSEEKHKPSAGSLYTLSEFFSYLEGPLPETRFPVNGVLGNSVNTGIKTGLGSLEKPQPGINNHE